MRFRPLLRHFLTLTLLRNPFAAARPFLSPSAAAFAPSRLLRHLHPAPCSARPLHALRQLPPLNAGDGGEADAPMEEFLSRFVHIIREKLTEVYPDCDKATVNGMLLVIVEKVVSELERGGLDEMLGAAAGSAQSLDLSEDLWRTIWETSNTVIEDMRKASRREEMKRFVQCEEVKEMCRFAQDVGIRGDLLRELRLKWAREKLEESEFYRELDRIRKEDELAEKVETEEGAAAAAADADAAADVGEGMDLSEEDKKAVTLPQRHGKIKYKIYGLDLSSPEWKEVADRIHEAEKLMTPEEPRAILGECKMVTERILGLKEEDDPSPHLAEWTKLLQPSRVDWLALLNRLKERNVPFYLKVAEAVLDEESFGSNILDYTKLIDAHARGNRIEDAERILRKMMEKGIVPDMLTLTILVHMYGEAGNLDQAKDAFEKLRSQGFQPDPKSYNAMIMAYVIAGHPKHGEALMLEMNAKGMKPSKEIYLELLRAFAQRGHVDGAQRIVTKLQYAGFKITLEYYTLLVEAYGLAGDPDEARHNFDLMIKSGCKPDDRCTASMLAAYEKKNLLDKGLNLLLDLEKDGFEPGVATYTILVDWLGKLQLVNEAEELLGKVGQMGETPLNLHISLCDMYSRAHQKQKALESLGILEQRRNLLKAHEFERIINGLLAGELIEDAKRIHELMQQQGFASSEPIKVALMAAQSIFWQKPATS